MRLMSPSNQMRELTHRRGLHASVWLGAVDTDGDLASGGAQLLVQAAVGSNPQVFLAYFHLEIDNSGNVMIVTMNFRFNLFDYNQEYSAVEVIVL